MVQRPVQQGEFSFSRDGTAWTRNERPFLDASQEHGFTQANSNVHPRETTIETALRECARIPIKDFVLAAIDENGEVKTYTSVSLAPHRQRIFNDHFITNLRHAVKRATQDPYSSSGYSQDAMYGELELDSGHERKSSGSSESRRHRKTRSDDSDEEGTSSSSRRQKRPRYPGQNREASNDDTPMPVPVMKTQQLVIGNDDEVEKFYSCRFKDMQQSACKVMGKAFVKLVEPKKQTHHPYTKGDDKAPPWWPPTTGDENVRVRHKEPDHLLKPERIRLLVWILRLIVEPPEKQCLTVSKLGLNVKKLEEVTMEAMSNWFNDKEHLENAQKRPYLKEIFKIAKAEERYRNGEIDGTTVIPVMHGERYGAVDGSDDEGEEQFKDEEDEHEMPPNTSSSLPTPDSMVSSGVGHNRHVHQEADSSNLVMRSLPHRHNSQPQPMEDHYSDPSSFFPRGLGVNFHQPRSPNLQDPARNQFVSPQSGFHSPQIFWPPNMVSNASTGNSFYVTSPQVSLPPSTSAYNSLPLPNAQQAMLPPPIVSQQNSFDGLPLGRTYDSTPALGSQLRTGSIGHPHHMPQHHSGFQEYLPDRDRKSVV